MRALKAVLATVGVAGALCFAPEALAQKAPGAGIDRSAIVGSWRGVIDWNNDELDGELGFTFNADGTFVDPFGETGSWSTTTSGIHIEYPEGGRTVYEGHLIGDTLIGTMQTNPPTLNGLFALRRN